MYRCHICRSMHSAPSALIQHLKFFHGLYPGKKFVVICAQEGCSLQFNSYAGFTKHLNGYHSSVNTSSDDLQTPHQSELDEQSLRDNAFGMDPDMTNQPSTSQMSNQPSTSQISKDKTKDMCASIIAKLQGSGVANNVVLSVIESMEEYVNDAHANLKEQVLSAVPADNPSRSAVEEVFNSTFNPFADLNTNSKWTKYFSEKWGVVEPLEMHLGVRYDSKRNKISGVYEQVPVNDTFVYIPLLKTLEFIFKNKVVCGQINKSATVVGLYQDLCDGKYYQNHPLYSKSKNSLQIQLYYDDFETSNPLGSKQGIHKLGCLYFTLRNLPPRLNSSLMNIHLISLFHSQDAKKYGIDKILTPFIEDVKILEHSGMKVSFTDQPVHGTIAQVTGDNLGLNSILGYVESFSANHYCRMCLIDKASAQTVFSESDPRVMLRTRSTNEEHYSHLVENPRENSCFGVKRNSIFNSLSYFNVSNNFVFDIMHDILEGVGQYEIKLLFEYLKQNFISYENILQRVYAFNYGFMDKKNRPTGVNMFCTGSGIGLNASQTLCLIRNLPLIFGDLVPEGDRHWHLLLLLLHIVNIVFSPCITEGMTVFLKHLIEEHHRLFTVLHPQNNLIPKHHFMIHYPECIRQIGPLVHVWSMRYEAKHKFFKSSIKNFKNITKTLAKKHQIAVAYHWESLSAKGIEAGPVSSKILTDFEHGDVIADYFQIDMLSEISVTNWVKHNGIEFHPDLVVCTDIVDEMPVFNKILCICLKGDIYFLLSEMDTEFVEHFHAFCVVDKEHCVSVVRPDDLRYFKPFDIQMSYGADSNFYVVPDSCII